LVVYCAIQSRLVCNSFMEVKLTVHDLIV